MAAYIGSLAVAQAAIHTQGTRSQQNSPMRLFIESKT